MLYRIARKIKTDYLEGISFADRTGGLVRVMKDARGGNERRYPIEFNQDKVLGDAQYMRRLVPDSNKTSIMYFEQGASPSVVERHNNWYYVEAELKLVCWYSYQKVDPDLYDPAYLISEIVQAIPQKIGNFECLAGVTCVYSGQDENDGSIFSDYTYNESETQFFKYPYDYFVLNFEIGYRVISDCYDNGLADVPVEPVLLKMAGNDAKTVRVFGVSGKEYQTYGYAGDDTVLNARALHEYSGEYQEYTVTPKAGEDSYFSIDYGREYLRAIDMADEDVSDITIPDDDNIRLEYIDLSDNAITTEASLVALIQHCTDTGVENGEMDISGGTNAGICDSTALSQITELITNRGWTITYNDCVHSLTVGNDGLGQYGYEVGSFGDLDPLSIDGVAVQKWVSTGVTVDIWMSGGGQIGSATQLSIDYSGHGTEVHTWDGSRYRSTSFALASFIQSENGNTIDVDITVL